MTVVKQFASADTSESNSAPVTPAAATLVDPERANNARPSVRDLNEPAADQAAWNAFLSANAHATFYQRYEWKRLNEREFGHRTFYYAALDGQTVAGVLPLVLMRSRIFGNILCSMPFVNFGGVAADYADAEVALIDHAIETADRQRVDYLELRSLEPSATPLPTATHKITMSLVLDSDPGILWNAFASKHRTAIRRVYKSGLRVESGKEEMLDSFYDIMVQSWRALGTPIYRKRYFRSILDSFGDQVRIFVAYHDSKPIATAFNGYFKQTVEGMWAGGLPQYRHFQANYALYWEMIEHACHAGFRSYNLGRSTVDSGAEAFKKKWNAEPHQLYWQYYLPSGGPLPQLNTSNAKYSLGIALWRRMPMWTTRLIGPLLARAIP